MAACRVWFQVCVDARETVNGWALSVSHREGPVPDAWQGALRHAVAAGTPAGGR